MLTRLKLQLINSQSTKLHLLNVASLKSQPLNVQPSKSMAVIACAEKSKPLKCSDQYSLFSAKFTKRHHYINMTHLQKQIIAYRKYQEQALRPRLWGHGI